MRNFLLGIGLGLIIGGLSAYLFTANYSMTNAEATSEASGEDVPNGAITLPPPPSFGVPKKNDVKKIPTH